MQMQATDGNEETTRRSNNGDYSSQRNFSNEALLRGTQVISEIRFTVVLSLR